MTQMADSQLSLPSISPAAGFTPLNGASNLTLPASPRNASRPQTSAILGSPQHAGPRPNGRPQTSIGGNRFEAIQARNDSSWSHTHNMPAHMAPRRKMDPSTSISPDSKPVSPNHVSNSPRGPRALSGRDFGGANPGPVIPQAFSPKIGRPTSPTAALHFHKRTPADVSNGIPMPTGNERPGTAGGYSWDSKYANLLKEKIGENEQGLIEALSSNPPVPDTQEADPNAVYWFHDNFPAATPAKRQDAIAVRKWAERQMESLKGAVHAGSSSATRAAEAAKEIQGKGNSKIGQLSDNGQDGFLMVRDAEGFLSASVLVHQEKLFTRCMLELCGQVCTSCLERGHLMHQLWAAMRQMLHSVLADRESSRNIMRDARRCEQTAADKAATAVSKAEAEKSEADQMCDVLNRRLLNARSDLEASKAKVLELEGHLREYSDVHPDQMRNRIEDLEVSLSSSQRACTAAIVRFEKTSKDLVERDKEVEILHQKQSETKTKLAEAAGAMGSRTPRPSQPKQPPWELLSEEETELTQQALRNGCSAEDMHRLLIGATSFGCNILKWFDIIGCCRSSTMADLQPDPLGGGANNHSNSVFAAEDDHQPGDDVAKKPTRPWCTSPSGETALHHKSSLFRQALTPLSELYPAMLSLLSLKKVKQLANCLSEAVVDRLSEMINHGIKPESMACLLLGTLSPEGYELKQYRSLAGILAKRYKQTVENIGGPITAALAAAGMTTKDRLEQLESQLLEQHRNAVRFHHSLKMRKRLEEVAAQHLLKSPKKFALPPNPALLLLSPELQCQHPDSFEPLGIAPEVPPILRGESSCYNRKMERLEAVRLARSILHCKSEFEASNNVKLHLSDYLYVYLSKKYGNIHTCTEIAFNLLFALGQYMHNPECSIFVKVFLGEVEETIFDAQIELKKKIIDAFTKEDIEQNHRATGWLCKKEMHTVLGELYPEEADLKQLHELLTALDEDYNKPMVNYTKIFDEYSEGCSNTFAETVLQQQIDERVAFLLATEDALLDQVSSESCTAANLSAALKKCHPDMEPEYAQELVERVFGASDMEVSKESKKGSKKGGKASSKSLPLSTALNLLRSPLSENSISLEDAMELATGKKVVILIQQAAHVEEKPAKKGKGKKKK